MFPYFSNFNFINTSKVYLFNKGISKYILWGDPDDDKLIFGSTGTLFKISDNDYSVLDIDNIGDEYHRFAILPPKMFDRRAKIGNIKNNKEMRVKFRKKFIEKDLYKLVFEDKCLTAENNELFWRICKHHNENQIWKFIDPINDKNRDDVDNDSLEKSDSISSTENIRNVIKKKEKEKLKLKALKKLESIFSENDIYPLYILKLSKDDHYKMPKSTEFELIK